MARYVMGQLIQFGEVRRGTLGLIVQDLTPDLAGAFAVEPGKGVLVADFTSRVLYPLGNHADLSYYKPRSEDKVLPAMGNFQKQWINACKSDLKTACDFEYSGNMIETILVGMVAYRAGKKIKYDGAAGKVIGDSEADALLRKTYREGWTLNG